MAELRHNLQPKRSTVYFMKKYLSEKNALTVMVGLFCLVMMFVALIAKQSYWEAIAFALAFSFSLEVVCHRAKENN
jgi:hypothetical protein